MLSGNLMLLSLNMGHSPDVILNAGLQVTIRAVYDHQGLVPCLLRWVRQSSAPSAGPRWWRLWNPKCPKIRKNPFKFVLLLGRAKLKLEPWVSGWLWQLWSDPGWRWRAEHTAALLSSAQFSSVLISSCTAAPGWCLSASSVARHALVPTAGMFRSTSGSCTSDAGVTLPPSSTAAAARAPLSGLSALFPPVCHVHF